jgi:type IV secretory pathway protease TraF
LRTGELLVVTPPEPLAMFLDTRRYLPKGVPLLKHIAALPGQSVCRTGDTISIDGSAVGAALDRDHLGRSLPVWQGCRVIAAGEVFLMNRQSVASLDGRYFGPLPTTTIVGRADPIWIEEAK